MVRLLSLALAVALTSGTPVAARSFLHCSKPEVAAATAALDKAAALAVHAAAAVGETDLYTRWFGPYSPARAERVRSILKAIRRELHDDRTTVVCRRPKDRDCTGAVAFVLQHTPGAIHICPDFFAMPRLDDAEIGDAAILRNGTQEGTLIHEISHFHYVGGTSDDCYSRIVCESLAQRSPVAAIATADSYQYFAEDVTIERQQQAD